MNILKPADPSDTTFQHLPVEMLDWILMKVLYFMEYDWVKTKQYVSNNALLRIISSLQTVTSAWTDRLNTNWFRVVFKRRRKRIESALSSCPVIVGREEWSARYPTSRAPLNTPVPMVIIHETTQPDGCYDEVCRCTQSHQYEQKFCMNSREVALPDCPVLVRRGEWFVRHPTSRVPLNEPVPMVVILNTVEPVRCYDERSCTRAVQSIQNFFIDDKGWADIAFNFLIGEDGRVYEGRGWKVHAAHTLGYNDLSLGIGFIGHFGRRAPCDAALRAMHELLRLGVKEGHIAENYSLCCHRDLRPDSKSPGQYLYEIIRGWPNYKLQDV